MTDRQKYENILTNLTASCNWTELNLLVLPITIENITQKKSTYSYYRCIFCFGGDLHLLVHLRYDYHLNFFDKVHLLTQVLLHFFTMSSNENNDLSPYELARLERIKRNEDRLRGLGLIDNPALKKPKVTPAKKVQKKRVTRTTSVPTRSSKRLKQLEGYGNNSIGEEDDEDATPITPDVDDIKVDYLNSTPKEPEQLDDHEFQVYASLRAWRLRRKNELEIEPYKICQNRTLCELIRKKRNDSTFLTDQGDQNNTVEDQLLSVWGIGPSKAAEGGFGWEMLEVLNAEDNAELLELSRKNVTQVTES